MTQKMQKFIETFNKKFFDFNPFYSSHLGLSQYDGIMPSNSIEAYEEETLFLEKSFSELKNLSNEAQDEGEKIDLKALEFFIENELFSRKELPYHSSMPEAARSLSSALYTVFSNEDQPLSQRLDSIRERLEKVSGYLAGERNMITDPVDIWVNNALQAADAFPIFIKTLKSAVQKNYSFKEQFFSSCDKALAAMEEYKSWLEAELLPKSQSRFHIGRDKFEQMLVNKHLGFNSDELIELGSHYLSQTKLKLDEIASKMGLSYETIKDQTRNDHPADFDEVLSFSRISMQKAKEYCASSGFATLPGGDVLEVKETPEIFRPFIPLAAYFAPGRFSKTQKGTYVVSRSENKEAMKDFNYTAILNKSIHEGYPGHHLHFVCANRNPSLFRLFTGSPEAIEGWAHYCEEAVSHGAFPDNEALHFTMNLELVWKACRIIIDVKLARGEMTIPEAVKMLMDEAAFTYSSAASEVNRYTYTPTYQLSYLTGKHIIQELKKELAGKYPKRFNERNFHDTFLSSGMLPLFLVAQIERSFFAGENDR